MSRLKIGRKSMVATSMGTDENFVTRMTYHNTVVAMMQGPKGSKHIPGKPSLIHLNNGGYYSVTTKRRMNQFAALTGTGFQVWQTKGEWFVEYTDSEGVKRTQPFEDGKASFVVGV